MVNKLVVKALAILWVATLIALFWMSEIAEDAPMVAQVIAVGILLSVGWALLRLARHLPPSSRASAIEGIEFPPRLADPFPAVLIRKVEPAATDLSPADPVLSWIGGQPPAPVQTWPVDPVTGEKMQHYVTLAFSDLTRHLPPDTVPRTGQLSFFMCKKDALAARARGMTPGDFAIVERAGEHGAGRAERDGDFPFAPIAFSDKHQGFDAPSPGQERHQVFGVGLDVQAQLEPVQDRQMLLQLARDDALGIDGVVQFMIDPEDLSARHWHKTVAVIASD